MLWLYVQAPFATFRNFTAGSFRPSAPFMTPSAAYGLLLNLAGNDDMRYDDGESAMTLIRQGLPQAEIALGSLVEPEHHCLYQQLHNYPVGPTNKEHAPACKGNKYNIAPVRRAVLSNLRACIGMRGNDALAEQIREGLAGRGPQRYGLPFLGDNNFLPDRIDLLSQPLPARWWVLVNADEETNGPLASVARLTVSIDRADMSQTQSRLFRVGTETGSYPSEGAWVKVGY